MAGDGVGAGGEEVGDTWKHRPTQGTQNDGGWGGGGGGGNGRGGVTHGNIGPHRALKTTGVGAGGGG